ncbi:uncharacterized protein EAF01_004719 [Botrytis porri]|uniref:uncharacterized protein n=1 Tax=Botrytis porri TaxID=87229 RepID=UPI0018FF5889|nr:uncharacterized protein EAF01_004719 [Botrytis porri]KAF7907132.1 hypothetical protein EAF01_004719 [Botrytis porri]
MASSIIKIEPLLASSMRVLRNQTTLQDLVAAYPSLKEKVLSSPKSLTESERRVFLDLPDPEMESANISAATRLSRAELIEKAVINRGSLTDAEVLVLKNRFWTPRTNDESSRLSEGFINTNDEARDEFLAVRTLAYLPKEKEAFKIRGREAYTRDRAARERPLHNATTAALPNAPEWIKQLHQEGKPHWGLSFFLMRPPRSSIKSDLDISNLFYVALRFNGSKDIISSKWRYMTFNAPQSALTHTQFSLQNDDRDEGDSDQDDGSQFRKAFQEILEDP